MWLTVSHRVTDGGAPTVREAIPGSYEVSALHNRWTSKTAPNRFKIRGEAKLVVLLGTAAVHHDHRHADMVYRARTSGGT